MSKRWK